MADQKQRRMPVGDKLAQDLDLLVGFLDPHLSARTETAEKVAPWSRRKTLAFILAGSILGWSLILGVLFLLDRLL